MKKTIKDLQLSETLIVHEGITVSEACKRMAERGVDVVLVVDTDGFVSAIITDKDIVTRVTAEKLKPDQTLVSQVMTKGLTCVTSNWRVIEALQLMVRVNFRHLPVENAIPIALLDITNCLDDAISRMEKVAEEGRIIAAEIEDAERRHGSNFLEVTALIDTLRKNKFEPSLCTIISRTSRVPLVSPSDSIYVAATIMRDLRVNSVLIMTGNNIQGMLTSKDILMQVVAKNLSPELTLVSKVMTPDPKCTTLDTTILEALRIMRDRRFLYLPVVDKDGNVVACVDVLQITYAAISTLENTSVVMKEAEQMVMRNILNSSFSLKPLDDSDTQSKMAFSFKLKDHKGCMHKFNLGTDNLAELVSAVMQRIGVSDDQKCPKLLVVIPFIADCFSCAFMYEDDEGDKVVLTTDGDLVAAVTRAKSVGHKVLRIHLKHYEERKSWSLRYGIFAGALITALVYLKCSKV